MYCNKAF